MENLWFPEFLLGRLSLFLVPESVSQEYTPLPPLFFRSPSGSLPDHHHPSPHRTSRDTFPLPANAVLLEGGEEWGQPNWPILKAKFKSNRENVLHEKYYDGSGRSVWHAWAQIAPSSSFPTPSHRRAWALRHLPAHTGPLLLIKGCGLTHV